MCKSVCVCLQVRAAAVFALGTYVVNTSEDGTSEMRVTIDQMVGSALLGLRNDGSTIVRKVCVCVGVDKDYRMLKNIIPEDCITSYLCDYVN